MFPHCPGETHTRFESSIIATMAPFVGLKMCLPLIRMTNLLPTAMTAAAINNAIDSLRSSRIARAPKSRRYADRTRRA